MRMLLCLLILLTACAGCEQPMSKVPLGTPWQDAEVAKLGDPWLLPGLGMPVHLAANKNGHCQAGLVVSEPDPNAGGESDLKLLRLDCVFTRIGKHEFVFYKAIQTEEDKKRAEANQTPEPEGFSFLYIVKRDDNHLTLAVATEAFKDLITSGKLPGEIKQQKKNSYALIDCDEKVFLAAIESVGFDKCFDLKTADTAQRIKPQPAKAKK